MADIHGYVDYESSLQVLTFLIAYVLIVTVTYLVDARREHGAPDRRDCATQ